MKKIGCAAWLLALYITFTSDSLKAQQSQFPAGMALSGTIMDSVTQIPLEYATIILYSQEDNQQVSGTVTNKEGRFELTRLRPGQYIVKIDYIGYQSRSFRNVALAPPHPETDLGYILLQPAILESQGVEISAEKPTFEYKIDKKIINVSQQPTAISGTAVDVLENVPSVTTDIDGNVQLRGSSSFTVLIDNRPTVLESNEALQQIPASTIESIEIITNPSAKFDPEGTSGIINIITKKNRKQGVTGIVNANIGLNDKYGGDFLLSKRTQKFNFFLSADYNKRTNPRTSQVEHYTVQNDTIHFVNSKGDGDWGMTGYGLRGGADYSMTNQDLLSLNFRIGGRAFKSSSENDYDEFTEPGQNHTYYKSMDEGERTGSFYSLNMDYKHTFEKKGHELLSSLMMSKRTGDEESINALRDIDNEITQSQRFLENGPSGRLRFNVDYTLPLRENDKFQAGFQSRIESSSEETERYDYDVNEKSYILQSAYSHSADYFDNIHAVYSMYAAEFNNLGFQGGLRGEYTDREIKLTDTGDTFVIDRWDYFPTAHLSYQFAKGRQMMISYTKRIERPHGWELEPFETWTDAYNVRKGNPGLKPEYIDSYETGYQTSWGRNLISLEAYYRKTHNKIERVNSVYDANISLHTTENVGQDYTLGAEIMTNVDLSKWWNLNLMGTIYHYKIEGDLFQSSFSRESKNWNVRINNTFKFGSTSRLQIIGIYNSPSVSSQGNREAFYVLNLGLKQDFLNRSLSATLQIRDLLKSGKFEFTTEGPDFSTHSLFKRSQTVMLTLTYNINNYKQERKSSQNNQEETIEEIEGSAGQY